MSTWLLLMFLIASPMALAAEDSGSADTEETYRLRAGDLVSIVVFDEPDLNVQGKLDPDGVIIVPLLGRTTLKGSTLRDAEAQLEKAYIDEEYLIKPQVTISVTQYAERVFYIFGEVASPGAKTFPPGRQSLDILEAISMAGDFSQYAKKSEVTLRRPIKGTSSEEKFVLDLEKLMRGSRRGEQESISILPDDIIYVPERMF
jgi:protein involved in polysaccharide export with SLBB domain